MVVCVAFSNNIPYISTMSKTGFKPIIGGKPKVLILGSMPGEASLEQSQYYANPRNLFWEIVARHFNFDHTVDYEQRKAQLVSNQIAVWDVIESCDRQGSLDSSIQSSSIIVNDFLNLFMSYPSISHVFFNGTKAQTEFNRNVKPELDTLLNQLELILLPSTSPANARMTRLEKLTQWSRLKLAFTDEV